MNKKTDKQQGELVYGVNPIQELLQAKKRKVISIYTVKPTIKAWDKIEKLLPPRTPIQYVARDVLSKIAGTNDHQGILAWATPFGYRKKMFDPAKQKQIVLLDGIQDVRNLGAILRSVYSTGFQGVVIPVKGGVGIQAAALKASAGFAEYLDIYITPSIQSAVQEIKQAGYHMYMAVLNGANAMEVEYKEPLCLVIGSEGVGITPAMIKMGTPITIGQVSDRSCYNASVAAGILLFLIAHKSHLIK